MDCFWLSNRGASIPSEAMMHFRFPPIFEKNSDSVENFPNCTFSHKSFDFHLQKFLMTFLFSHWLQILNPLYFPCFSTCPPILGKLLFPPCFCKNSPWFRKIYVLFTGLCVFHLPLVLPWCIYASHINYWTPLLSNIRNESLLQPFLYGNIRELSVPADS